MQLIIPLQAMRRTLRKRMEDHALKHNYDYYGTITETRLVELLIALIQDDVARNLKYKVERDNAAELLAKLYPIWTEETREHFRDEVIVELEEELTRWLEDYLPKYEWHVWSFQTLGRDLLITIGEDYRVRDWTRRMASGEWSEHL